ncbi:MAG: protein translocase subunit SecD [Halanaerobiales bacterium]
MDFKQKQLIKIGIVVAIIIVSAGFYYVNGINLGLDLEGGTQIVMEARPEEGDEVTDDQMESIRTIIENRVNEMGLTEPVIQRQGQKRLIIELPAVDNPNQAIESIGKTALLTIRDEADNVLLTGEHVVDAQARYDDKGAAIVSFSLDSEGANEFAEITRQFSREGKMLGFFLDEEELFMGNVQGEISEEGQMQGFGKDIEEAQEVAMLIREGALPVPLEAVGSRHMGATLGDISLRRSIIAGLIGLLMVSIYMIIYYKFPGVIVSAVLLIYGIIFLGTLAGFGATLTLPGIAGLVLSIGMAVDANIIIYERIKDEIKSGKKTKTAINAGFKRAYRTIIDANITTLIAALILAYYTTGSIRGFAVVLIIGLVVSMFTAFVVTRILLDLFMETKLLKSKQAFGAQRR